MHEPGYNEDVQTDTQTERGVVIHLFWDSSTDRRIINIPDSSLTADTGIDICVILCRHKGGVFYTVMNLYQTQQGRVFSSNEGIGFLWLINRRVNLVYETREKAVYRSRGVKEDLTWFKRLAVNVPRIEKCAADSWVDVLMV